MHCHECGTQIPEDVGTCPECGAAVGASRTEREGDEQPSTERTEPADQSGGPAAEPAGREESGDDGVPDAPDRNQAPQGQPSQGQPPRDQPAQGQPPQDQPSRGQPQGQQPQGQPQGQPPQGQPQQGPAPHATPQNAPGGGGDRGPGGPPGGGSGYGGGYGQRGGLDMEYLLDTLPLLPGAVAGAATGILLLVFGVVFASVADAFPTNALEIGAVILFDLQFSTPRHLTPFLYNNFEVVAPPAAALGFLYLLAPLLLYKMAKIVVGFGLDDGTTLQDSAMAGATVVLGYFPVMLIAGVLIPSTASAQFSLGTAIFLAGLVYPLLFGALGGLSAGKLTVGQRRIGLLYGVVGFFGVLIGLFLTSFVYLNTGPIDVSVLERLLASLAVLAQVHGLSLGSAAQSAIVAYLTVILIVALVGFVRVWRSSAVQTPVDGFAIALTPAVTYITLFGFFVSSALIFADSYIQQELELGMLFAAIARALVTQSAGTIGEYVNLVVVGFLVFPVVIGGAGGLAAWYLQNRQRQPYYSSD